MIGQILLDGVLTGCLIALGAIGLTLSYAVLRFANFMQGEMLTLGAYLALALAAGFAPLLGGATIGPFTFGWPLVLASGLAAGLTGLFALAIDHALFRRLRRTGASIGMVIASFGAALAVRSAVEFAATGRPRELTADIPIALPLGWGLRATPDELCLLATTLLLLGVTQWLMTRTELGRAMRAVSENPDLARVCGIDVAGVVRATWLLGGGLAALAGVFLGLLAQVRPYMGFDLLLPMFAAAILGGIGSVPGAVAGGLIVGVGEAFAVPLLGAEYRAAVAFALLIGVLVLRPAGLFAGGEAA